MAETELTKNKIFTVSSSPHVRCEESISKIMWSVNIALAPAAIFGIYHFGLAALKIIIVSILSAVITEAVITKNKE
jgi:Predicted NADH:ubiquinone oxidoreductase, subunit RnfD